MLRSLNEEYDSFRVIGTQLPDVNVCEVSESAHWQYPRPHDRSHNNGDYFLLTTQNHAQA